MTQSEKIVHISGKPVEDAMNGEPNLDIVTAVEALLADAKSGKLQGLAFVGFDSVMQAKPGYVASTTILPVAMFGGIELLKGIFFMSQMIRFGQES